MNIDLNNEVNQDVINIVRSAAHEIENGNIKLAKSHIEDAIITFFGDEANRDAWKDYWTMAQSTLDKTSHKGEPVAAGAAELANIATSNIAFLNDFGDSIGYPEFDISYAFDNSHDDEIITAMVDLLDLIDREGLTDLSEDVEQEFEYDRGFNVSQDRLILPGESKRLPIDIDSTIIDTLAGQTITYQLFGDEANQPFLDNMFQKEDVVNDVQEFFLTNKVEGLMVSLLGGAKQTHYIGSKTSSYEDVLEEISKYVMSKESQLVIAEILMPFLSNNETGFVSTNRKYSFQVSHPYKRVTIHDLRSSIVLANINEALNGIKYMSSVPSKTRVSVRVYAENISRSFEPIGLVLQDTQKYDSILDDIIIGVKNNIDPVQRKTSGTIPIGWRNHEIVHTFSRNWVFVNAALVLNGKKATSLSNDTYTLEKFAPSLIASLRLSTRYKIVSKTEFLASVGVHKVRDMSGKPKCAIMYNDLKIDRIAQALYAHRRDDDKTLINVFPTREPIAGDIQSAYGTLDFSIASLANTASEVLSYLIEQGYETAYDLYIFDSSHLDINLTEVAALSCDQLYVSIDTMGKVRDSNNYKLGADVTTFTPEWWFRSKRFDLSYKPRNATLSGDSFYTMDPVEFFMIAEEFGSISSTTHKNQLLGQEAFNSTLINFDVESNLSRISSRYTFNLKLDSGTRCRGTLSSESLVATRGANNLYLVIPKFDSDVAEGYALSFKALKSELELHASKSANWATGIVSDGAIKLANRVLAQKFVDVTRQINPAFRTEVQERMVESSINGFVRENSHDYTAAEIDSLRSRLSQNTIGAMADIESFFYLMHLQGIEVGTLNEMKDDEEVKLICITSGSDRKALDF